MITDWLRRLGHGIPWLSAAALAILGFRNLAELESFRTEASFRPRTISGKEVSRLLGERRAVDDLRLSVLYFTKLNDCTEITWEIDLLTRSAVSSRVQIFVVPVEFTALELTQFREHFDSRVAFLDPGGPRRLESLSLPSTPYRVIFDRREKMILSEDRPGRTAESREEAMRRISSLAAASASS